MKEILVHLSAPTSRKDDERYRTLAEAYDDFEPANTINCTARTHVNSTMNQGDHRTPAAPYGTPATPANDRSLPRRNPRRGVASAKQTPRSAETPAAAGFVEPAQIVPASRQSAAKGRRAEIFAQAPDYGSFMSTPPSRSPIHQLHELEKRWLHQQRSSMKRSASGQQRTSTGGNIPQLVFIENTPEALAALEDHIDTSSYGSDPHFSELESPVTQASSKRPRLSSDFSSPETTRAIHDAGSQELCIPNTWMPPPRTPPRADMSSQMPDDYGLSDSGSSLRDFDRFGLIVQNKLGSVEALGITPETGVPQPSSTPETQSFTEEANQEGMSKESRQFQVSTQGVSDGIEVGDPGDSTELQADATTTPVRPTTDIPTTPAPAEAQGSSDLVFNALPLQLFPKLPSLGTKRNWNEVTSMLQSYVEKATITKHYKPQSVSREIRPTERGCWMFDTSNWEPRRQYEFWTRMQYLLDQGYLGNVWLQRNIAKDWKRGGTDGDEAKGLGVVWMFCWGQAVPYLWVVMLVESHMEIRRKKSKAQWTVGPMENLEVVVRMPEPAGPGR